MHISTLSSSSNKEVKSVLDSHADTFVPGATWKVMNILELSVMYIHTPRVINHQYKFMWLNSFSLQSSNW
jgi:hypothetical protein